MLFATLISAFNVLAYDFEVDGIYYNILSGNTCEVGNGSGLSGNTEIVIPATVTYNDVQYSVISIGAGALYNCSKLTSLVIPESVTSIGSSAFSGCSSLSSINIPENITTIEEDTFYNCSSLTSINIPEGVTSIGSSAFSGCI